jgi:hypothetical protein
MEVRIVNSAFLDSPGSRIAKRDIRAVEGGAPISGVRGAIGVLEYDAPDSIHWTARFTGLNEAERQLVVEGQTRVLSWMAANENGDRLGITIYEVGEVGGPGFGGCPAGPIPPPAPQPADPPVKYDPAALLDAADPAADLAQLHEIIVFPERDFVAVAGYAAGANLQLVVRRPNVGVIGSARGTTDRSGLLEVNHPGGVCWTGQTPDIRAGDLVDVFEYDDPSLFTAGDETFLGGETQRTVDVRVTAPAFVDATGDVVVLGTAVRPDGSPATDAELAMMEQRIINAEFMNTAVGRRDIRAVVDGGSVGNLAGASSTLQRDPLDPFNWIATYRGLGEAEKRLAVEGQSRAIAWLATNAGGDRFGITIFEFGELGGPGFGGCPQRGDLSIPLP